MYEVYTTKLFKNIQTVKFNIYDKNYTFFYTFLAKIILLVYFFKKKSIKNIPFL